MKDEKRPVGVTVFGYLGIILGVLGAMQDFFIIHPYNPALIGSSLSLVSAFLSYHLLRLNNWARVSLLVLNSTVAILATISLVFIFFGQTWQELAGKFSEALPNFTTLILIISITGILYLYGFIFYFKRSIVKKQFVKGTFKKKYLAGVAGIFLLTMVLNFLFNSFQTKGIYVNKKLGFSFVVPEGYKLSKKTKSVDDKGCILIFKGPNDSNFIMTVLPSPGGVQRSTPQERVKFKSALENKGFKILSERVFSLLENECYELIVSDEAKNLSLDNFHKIKKTRYVDFDEGLVSFITRAYAFDELNPVFDKILKTIKFSSLKVKE